MAKAAVIAMTRNLAHDLAPRVWVNAIAPGAIDTPALALVTADEGLTQALVDNTPMRRIGPPPTSRPPTGSAAPVTG